MTAVGEQVREWSNYFHLAGEVSREGAELKGCFNSKASPNISSANLEEITALHARIFELVKALLASTKKVNRRRFAFL